MATESASDNRLRAHATRGATWPRGAAVAVALAAVAAAGGAAVLDAWWLHSGAVVWRAAVASAAGGALVLWLATQHLRTATFGAANGVTLARGALTVVLLALLGTDGHAAWAIVALAVLAAALDGIDGALARNRGETSEFGARFDMETDALLILVLAALAWSGGKAGAWILLAGLLRYLFVAASWLWTWLAAPLPPSRRRQTVCVVQIVSLIVALVPIVTPPSSAVLALLGLVVLAWSFGVDVGWLARHARS